MATDAEAGITDLMRQRQHDLVFVRSKTTPRRFKQSNEFTQAPPIPRRVKS